MNWFGPSGDCGCCGVCQSGQCSDHDWSWGVKVCNLVEGSGFSLANSNNLTAFNLFDDQFFTVPTTTNTPSLAIGTLSVSISALELQFGSTAVIFDGYTVSWSISEQPDCERILNATIGWNLAAKQTSQCPTLGETVIESSQTNEGCGIGLPLSAIVPASMLVNGNIGGTCFPNAVSLTSGPFASGTLILVRGQSGVSDPGC